MTGKEASLMTAFVSHTTIDCADAFALSEWWKRVLGYDDIEGGRQRILHIALGGRGRRLIGRRQMVEPRSGHGWRNENSMGAMCTHSG